MANNWTIFKKKKKTFQAKKKAGAELKKKIEQFKEKKKKKRLFGPKRNKPGLSLKRKKGVSRAKNWGEIECKGQKLNNLKKRKENTIDRF